MEDHHGGLELAEAPGGPGAMVSLILPTLRNRPDDVAEEETGALRGMPAK
jgi:hypothetical protein